MPVKHPNNVGTLPEKLLRSHWLDSDKERTGFQLLVATVCFAFQIYCDFGSYSNMAVGVARVMGFRLMENFNTPYFAVSVADFWRRWHISFSAWFRDYLYIPLEGQRDMCVLDTIFHICYDD